MPFQRMQWLFPIAVALHNGEEAVSMPKWMAAHTTQLPVHPDVARIRMGLLVLTVAAVVVTYLSARSGKRSVGAYLLFGSIVAMLINVFVPHIPATLVLGEYTPGIITAVLINLPVMGILVFKAVAEDWVSGLKGWVYALLTPAAIAGAIAALFVLS